MNRVRILYFGAVLIASLGALGVFQSDSNELGGAQQTLLTAPKLELADAWPKPLPNGSTIGEVPGVAMDSSNHVWIVHRYRGVKDAKGAPPVIQFDTDGNFIQGWGGPGEGFEWPNSEHGIFVDYKDNVWIGGNGRGDHQVLKFSRDGTFLLQIGQAGKTGGSNDPKLLGAPADIAVDPETNEVYIADGYQNKRVIVFDADTGAYKRHWGAYGNKPDDTNLGQYDPEAPPAKQFRGPVHCVRISNDGLVYVGDRGSNRIQAFKKDGTFVEEVYLSTHTLGMGATWDVEFSPDNEQQLLYTSDGTNQQVTVLGRKGLKTLEQFGGDGNGPGEFHWLHSIAIDEDGNLYTAEVATGRRMQKYFNRGS